MAVRKASLSPDPFPLKDSAVIPDPFLPPVRRSSPLLLALALLSVASVSLGAHWTVLPKETHPYSSPSTAAGKVAAVTLRYPETIQEVEAPRPADAADSSQWIAFTHEGRCLYMPEAMLVRQSSMDQADPDGLPIGREVVDRRAPLPLDYQPKDLVALDEKWNFHTDMPKRLRREAAEATERMLSEARARDCIELRVISAYRSASAQRSNYLRKIAESGPDQQLVAKPGHSEHQLGTTVDLCATDSKTALRAEFAQTPEGQWLRLHAAEYGFRFSYTEENASETGYRSEPWHLRYMGKPQER